MWIQKVHSCLKFVLAGLLLVSLCKHNLQMNFQKPIYFTFLSLWSIVLVLSSILGCNAEDPRENDDRVGTYTLIHTEVEIS